MKRNHRLGKYSSIRWMLWWAIAFPTLFQGVDAADKTAHSKPPCCVQELGSAQAIPDTSIYQIDSKWTKDTGEVIKLDVLRGRPQVITMFFANCEYACPLLENDMRKLEEALPIEVRTNVGFVLISFDSDRDTPGALAKHRRMKSLPGRWTLLTAQPDDILELSQLLGVKFNKDVRGQFSHSNIITILNAQGEIVFQQIGLNREPTESVSALKQLFAKTETKIESPIPTNPLP